MLMADGVEGDGALLGKREESTPTEENSLYKAFEKAKKTLYVSNLRIGASQADILSMLTITSTIDDIRIINRKRQGQEESSIAYIDFDSPEAALEAKEELNGKIVFGRKLKAEISKPPTKADNTNTLFLNNLPYGMEEGELIKELKLDTSILVNISMKRSYAFVKYVDEKSMKLAKMELIGKQLRGRNLIVKEAERKKGEKSDTRVKKKMKVKSNLFSGLEIKEEKKKEEQPMLGKSEGMEEKQVVEAEGKMDEEKKEEQPNKVKEEKKKKKKKKKKNKDFKALFGL